jgi:hypothetical protein
LFDIPESSIKEDIIIYGGFPAEDDSYLFWSRTPKTEEKYLMKKLSLIRGSAAPIPKV